MISGLLLVITGLSLWAQTEWVSEPQYYVRFQQHNLRESGGMHSVHADLFPENQVNKNITLLRAPELSNDRFNHVNAALKMHYATDDQKISFGADVNYLWGLDTDATEAVQDHGLSLVGWFEYNATVANGFQLVPSWVYSTKAESGAIDYGLYIKGEDLYFRRPVRKPQANGSSGYSFDYKLWSPMRLASGDQKGWYFIALTQTQWITRVFLGRHGANENLLVKYYFLGFPSGMFGNSTFEVGPFDTHEGQLSAVSDYAAWQKKLEIDEVKNLYECSNAAEMNTCWGENANLNALPPAQAAPATTPADTDELPLAEETPANYQLVVFPNPNEGVFQMRFGLENPSGVNIAVVSAEGTVVYNQQLEVTEGLSEFYVQLPASIKAGIYIVNVRSQEFNHAKKIIVN